MPVHSYFVLIAFSLLLVVLISVLLRFKGSGTRFIGKPTIEAVYFYSAKIALFTSWGLFMVKAISPMVGYINLPEFISWIAVVILYLGAIIVSVSMVNLGRSLAVGLPEKETTLQTHGLYRMSRNPLYVGVHLIAIASCIYFPDLINISFTIYGIYMHHRIIRNEEYFLEKRFGKEWLIYSTKVSRYL
ncbi:MAG: methyltransferase family protein [Bacteroidales bacterium]